MLLLLMVGRLCDLIIADMQVLAIRRGTANRPHHRTSYSMTACQ
jgi:hypothetical protein